MALLASSMCSSLWTPEDDLSLKNAVEAGASFEALAKGAVQFSRKFTIQELRDRWHSLLYDPSVSHEASKRMTEFELFTSFLGSKSKKNGTTKGSSELPAKRKLESVRKLYHALQKRTRRRSSNSIVQSFLCSPDNSDSLGYGKSGRELVRHCNKPSDEHLMIEDCVQNPFELQEIDLDILHDGPQDHKPQGSVKMNFINAVPDKVPSWSGNESMTVNNFDKTAAHEDTPGVVVESANKFRNSQSVQEVHPSDAVPENNSLFHSTGCSSPQPGMPLWKTIEDISAPSMPVDRVEGQNAEDILPVLDGEKVTSSACDPVHSGTVSVFKEGYTRDDTVNVCAVSETEVDLSESLLNFSNEDDLPLMDVDKKTTTDKSSCACPKPISLSSSDVVCKEPEICVSNEISANQGDACPPEANMPSSTSIVHPDSPPELHDEMECGWNTEDPEIPDNDHIFPSETALPARVRKHQGENSNGPSSFGCKLQNSGQKEVTLSDSVPAASQVMGSDMLGTIQNIKHGNGVKRELPDDKHNAEISVQAFTGSGVQSQKRSAPSVSGPATNVGLETEALSVNPESNITKFPNPEGNSSSLEPEKPSTSDESENDDSIPCFSDIETMILEMDLFPDEGDSCASREGYLNYQDEATRRSIIRLEQSAQSSMHRSIAARGAFAMIYGRHLKHYMRETKVVLGRATMENYVDIDLSREGPANKISRHQAIIKLEKNGSFVLENIGKNSIFLNGVEVETKQSASLSSSSLIEIRDMSFMFEINHKAVKHYLSKIAVRNHLGKSQLEWSEEAVP